MTALERTAIGGFSVGEAVAANDLDADNIAQCLLPVDHCLQGVERVVLNDDQALGLVDAKPVCLPDCGGAERVVAVDGQGRVLAILIRREDSIFTPKINFSKYWNG